MNEGGNNNISGPNVSIMAQAAFYNDLQNAKDEFVTIDLFGHPVSVQTGFVDSRGRRSNAQPITVSTHPTTVSNIDKTTVTAVSKVVRNGNGTAPFVWNYAPAFAFRRINRNQKRKPENQQSLGYLNYLI